MDKSSRDDLWSLLTSILSWVFMVIGICISLYFTFLKAAEQAIITLLITLALEIALQKYDSHSVAKRTKEIEEVIRHLSSALGVKGGSGELVIPIYLQTKGDGIPDIRKQASAAKEIWSLFVTGADLVGKHGGFLRAKCLANCKIRVLFAQEGSESLRWYERQYEAEKNYTDPDRNILEEAKNTKKLLADLPESSVEVKCIDGYIPFTMFATNPRKPTGEIVVGFQTYRGFAGQRPYIYVTKGSPWYKFFIDQYEAMWRAAKDVE